MTTITRERAEIKSFITGFLSDSAHDSQSSTSLLVNVFRIALASLEAEPVGEFYECKPGDWYQRSVGDKTPKWVPLYAVPPAPVVPEVMNLAHAQREVGFNRYIRAGYIDGWNACRAAMLQGSQPVSQTPQEGSQ